MRKLAVVVFCALLVHVHVQTRTASAQAVVRYHFGDDAHWADPDLDDAQWPIAAEGRVPSRSRDHDGFVWVRLRVPVEKGAQAPLAIHLSGLGVEPMVWQVYVNGLAVGGQGTFPPSAWPVFTPHSPVMKLPQAVSPPGANAVIAIREWYVPWLFTIQDSNSPSVSSPSHILRLPRGAVRVVVSISPGTMCSMIVRVLQRSYIGLGWPHRSDRNSVLRLKPSDRYGS